MTEETAKAKRSFTSRKLSWLNRAARDQRLTHLTVRVALALSNHFNAETGSAFAGQNGIAEALGITRRGAQICLDALRIAGYLAIEVGGGRGHTNAYRMLDVDPETANVHSPNEGVKGEPAFAPTSPKGRTAIPERANGHSTNSEPPFAQNTLGNTFKNTKDISSSFESFWRAFPRKAERSAAQNLYSEIVGRRQASPDQLLKGAQRYAQEVEDNGIEPKFIKKPVTWLSKGCWTDETPPRSSQEVVWRPL